MKHREIIKHYKEISFFENMARLKLLREFREAVIRYFDYSTLNMLTGENVEKPEATEARACINLFLNKAYKMIRLADLTPSAQSSPALAVRGIGRNVDLILNIFNLGKNEIPPSAAIDYIEMAIDIYKANRIKSFFRTINPLYWLDTFLGFISRRLKKKDISVQNNGKQALP